MRPRPVIVVGFALAVVLLVPLWGAYGMIGGGGGGHTGHGGGEAHGGHHGGGGGPEAANQEFIDQRKAFVAKNMGVEDCVWPPSEPSMEGMDHEGMDMEGMDHETEGTEEDSEHGHDDSEDGHDDAQGEHDDAQGRDREDDTEGMDHDMEGMDMEGMDHAEEAPTVYLEAVSWTFLPQKLCLQRGVTYKFKMMATDVTHGASIQTGTGSDMIRLPAGQEVEQDITFTKPGKYLVYCSYYCGIGHPFMAGQIIVE